MSHHQPRSDHCDLIIVKKIYYNYFKNNNNNNSDTKYHDSFEQNFIITKFN
jgi:hypothetical protein